MFQSNPQRIFGVPVAKHVDTALKSYWKNLQRVDKQGYDTTAFETALRYAPAAAELLPWGAKKAVKKAFKIYHGHQKAVAAAIPAPWVYHHKRSYTKYKRPYKRRRSLQYKHGKRHRFAYRKPYRARRYGYKIYKKKKLQRKYKRKRKINNYY